MGWLSACVEAEAGTQIALDAGGVEGGGLLSWWRVATVEPFRWCPLAKLYMQPCSIQGFHTPRDRSECCHKWVSFQVDVGVAVTTVLGRPCPISVSFGCGMVVSFQSRIGIITDRKFGPSRVI